MSTKTMKTVTTTERPAVRATTASILHVHSVDVVLLAGILNFAWLGRNSYGNLYYAATVKSMTMSWHNFFYASFDPGGFVAIDKPPLGFWVQAASAKLLGFPLGLLLPQALAGVFSVVLLYYLVRRAWGELAGVLAALMLALTPISVATNRDNAVDSLLVLDMLLATWAVSRAAERGRLRTLLLGAVLVGLGFNIKGLQAYMVLPAFAALYLLVPPLSRRTRLAHLALATIILVPVSLAWVVAVDLTPAAQRPFVGSTTRNTALDLTLGFNGLDRLLYGHRLTPAVLDAQQHIGFGPGRPGALRLLDRQLGGQIGWLLPVAIVGLLVCCWYARRHLLLPSQRRALILWSSWFLTQLAFFDADNFFHPYYLVMLAPAIAALASMGIVTLWRDYNHPDGLGWLLPMGLVGTATIQAFILDSFPSWGQWLAPPIVGLCTAVGGTLTAARFTHRPHGDTRTGVAVTVGMLALLIAPVAFASVPVWHRGGATLPFAGPDVLGSIDAQGPDDTHSETVLKLAHYLLARQGHARYLLATPDAVVAAPLILVTGRPVMAFGGFAGKDRILTTGRLTELAAAGTVRFFLLIQPFPWLVPPFLPDGGNGQVAQIDRWAKRRCRIVPTNLWQVAPGFGPIEAQLYDCAQVRHHGR